MAGFFPSSCPVFAASTVPGAEYFLASASSALDAGFAQDLFAAPFAASAGGVLTPPASPSAFFGQTCPGFGAASVASVAESVDRLDLNYNYSSWPFVISQSRALRGEWAGCDGLGLGQSFSNDSTFAWGYNGLVMGSAAPVPMSDFPGSPNTPTFVMSTFGTAGPKDFLFDADPCVPYPPFHEMLEKMKVSQQVQLKQYRCCLTDCESHQLRSALSLNSSITHLDLSYNCLAHPASFLPGAAAIVDVLRSLTSLTHLNLADNWLSADDVAMLCGAVAAAGLTQLRDLFVREQRLSAAQVVASETWNRLQLPPPPTDFVDLILNYQLGHLLSYIMSEDRATFAAHFHPALPMSYLQSIATSHSEQLTVCFRREGQHHVQLGPRGGRLLAVALSSNSCITSLSLTRQNLCSSGLSAVMGAITHLTTLTCLNLELNHLCADDVAVVCRLAATPGMSKLSSLTLCESGLTLANVLSCDSWRRLQLPQLPCDFQDIFPVINCPESIHHHDYEVELEWFGFGWCVPDWLPLVQFIIKFESNLACRAVSCSRTFSLASLQLLGTSPPRLCQPALPPLSLTHQQQLQLLASGGFFLFVIRKMSAMRGVALWVARRLLFHAVCRVKGAAAAYSHYIHSTALTVPNVAASDIHLAQLARVLQATAAELKPCDVSAQPMGADADSDEQHQRRRKKQK